MNESSEIMCQTKKKEENCKCKQGQMTINENNSLGTQAWTTKLPIFIWLVTQMWRYVRAEKCHELFQD